MTKGSIIGAVLAAGMLLASSSAFASPRWNESTVSQITAGESQDQIADQIGEPTVRREALGGREVWVYKKPAAGHGFANGYMAVASFGMFHGSNAVRQDVLTVTFENGKVVDAAYDPNTNQGFTSGPFQ